MSGLTLFVVWSLALPAGAYWHTMYVSCQVMECTVVTVVATPQPISKEFAQTTCKHGGSKFWGPLVCFHTELCLSDDCGWLQLSCTCTRKDFLNMLYLCEVFSGAWCGRSCPCVVVVRTVDCLLVPVTKALFQRCVFAADALTARCFAHAKTIEWQDRNVTDTHARVHDCTAYKPCAIHKCRPLFTAHQANRAEERESCRF